MVENKYILYFSIMLGLSCYNIINVYLINLHSKLSWKYYKKTEKYVTMYFSEQSGLSLNIHSSDITLDK